MINYIFSASKRYDNSFNLNYCLIFNFNLKAIKIIVINNIKENTYFY